MSRIREAIKELLGKKDLSDELMANVMNEIMEGSATDAQIGAFLVALRMKGESPSEICQAAKIMRQKALKIEPNLEEGQQLIDTCGTGGDGANTFNISTTSAFVVAGAGVKVAKHGNRSISSRSGSADLLEALGINISMPPEKVQRAIEEIGIGFLFAPSLHPAMKHVIGPRRELGVRTVFNVLGPLTNPAGANCQVLGVFDKELVSVLAKVLQLLGEESAWVVHGLDGLDEISLCDKTRVASLKHGQIDEFDFDPRKYGFTFCDSSELKGGSPEENAKITINLLKGEKGPKRDVVLLNAAAAILVAQMEDNFKDAIKRAEDSIDSGMALKKLEDLREFSK